jgi:hypothetical protein
MPGDTRLTIPSGGSFEGFLKTLHQLGEEVHLLYDDHGITRANGKIKSIFNDNNGAFLEMEDGKRIQIENIVAVNGVFAGDYSEC